MIKIVPDKEGKLTQWDLNRKVIVTGYEGVAEVHFASPGDDHGAYVVELKDGEAEIPNILLTMAGTINVYVYPADRTVFATTLWVMAREKPDDYVYTETEVLDWRTLDEKIGDLAKLTTTARENLVAAINEAATKGMASIYMRVEKGYIEYSGDGVNWKQLIAVAELKGEKGDKGDKGDKGEKGDPGSDATVDIVTPTAESTDTQAASAKAVWDISGDLSALKTTAKNNLVNALNEVHDDISLGLTGAAVGDIIKVKAVDASGKPTAWEAAKTQSLLRLVGEYTLSENATLFEVNNLNINADVISLGLKKGGTNCATGISIWLNGVKSFSYYGTFSDNSNAYHTRVWLWKQDNQWRWYNSQADGAINNGTYASGAISTPITSIGLSTPYMDGNTAEDVTEGKYIASGAVMQICEGVFPNVN